MKRSEALRSSFKALLDPPGSQGSKTPIQVDMGVAVADARRTVDTDPPELGSKEVNAFLTHLAVELHVSASTQNQALSAFLFLYRELLERDLDLEGLVRARTRPRLPLVMTVEELRAVLERLEALVAGVLYGGGLRLMEALRRRLHDLDVQRSQITVRHGKGGKDRRTTLPSRVGEQLQSHLLEVRCLHRQDLAEGYERVRLPHALGRKDPHAPVEWG